MLWITDGLREHPDLSYGGLVQPASDVRNPVCVPVYCNNTSGELHPERRFDVGNPPLGQFELDRLPVPPASFTSAQASAESTE